MVLLNTTGTIGIIITAITTNITGSDYITLLLITFIIFGFFSIFRIPIEISAILILPLMIIIMAFSGQYMTIGLLILIFAGILFAKKFFLN